MFICGQAKSTLMHVDILFHLNAFLVGQIAIPLFLSDGITMA